MTYRELMRRLLVLAGEQSKLLDEPVICRMHIEKDTFREGKVTFGPQEDWPVLDVPDSKVVQS
jgi:hypothetical protein